MRRLIVLSVTTLVAAGALTGCRPGYTTPTTTALAARRELTSAERNFEAYWRASLDVLRSYEFEIDRHDRRAAIITTKPMLGRHFFEVWRRDAVTYFDMTEGTLQSIYKTVTVKLVPGGAPGTFQPEVTVALERANREVVGAPTEADALDMVIMSNRDERMETLRGTPRRPNEDSVRSKVGEHKGLARKLVTEIRAKAAQHLGRSDPPARAPRPTPPARKPASPPKT